METGFNTLNNEHNDVAERCLQLETNLLLAQEAKVRWSYDRDVARHEVEETIARAAVSHAALLGQLANYESELALRQDEPERAYQLLAARAYVFQESPFTPSTAVRLAGHGGAFLAGTDSMREIVESAGEGWALDSYEAWIGLPAPVGEPSGNEGLSLLILALRVLASSRTD